MYQWYKERGLYNKVMPYKDRDKRLEYHRSYNKKYFQENKEKELKRDKIWN